MSGVDLLTNEEDDLDILESLRVLSPGLSYGVASFEVWYGTADYHYQVGLRGVAGADKVRTEYRGVEMRRDEVTGTAGLVDWPHECEWSPGLV